MDSELIAAVDLGSNSFRLQLGRVVGNQIFPLDDLKESVRPAAGLGRAGRAERQTRLAAAAVLSCNATEWAKSRAVAGERHLRKRHAGSGS